MSSFVFQPNPFISGRILYPEEFLGRKSDEEVIEYMKNCKALIFPGLEDFGITPVEAMACGKPVIFYNKGGVSESVIPYSKENRDNKTATGISFENQTFQDLSEAVEKFETHELQEFFNSADQIKNIQNRAERFSEEKFKEQIKTIINKVIK